MPRSLAVDGKIKSKESDSRADLQAILGLTVAEKFEELSCDGDWVVQLVQWTVDLTFGTARLQKKSLTSLHMHHQRTMNTALKLLEVKESRAAVNSNPNARETHLCVFRLYIIVVFILVKSGQMHTHQFTTLV